MKQQKYPCPCCGCFTFGEEPKGNYDICPVCYWEDDPDAYDDPDEAFGCNGVSFTEARQNYQKFGACREDMVSYVRRPFEDELPECWKTDPASLSIRGNEK